MDTERQFLAASVCPLQVRVFDIWREVAAGEVTVAVRFESEARGEFLVVGEVVREIDPPEPQPVLSFDRSRIADADSVLMPVVLPVVVPKHQSTELARRIFRLLALLRFRERLARQSVLEVVQIDRVLAVEDDGLTVRPVTRALNDRAGLGAVALHERRVSRGICEDVDAAVLRNLVI